MGETLTFEVFDLRFLNNDDAYIILKEIDQDKKIEIPIANHEFDFIKDSLLKKDYISYIDSLSQMFSIARNELILEDKNIKSKITLLDTNRNISKLIILSPFEPLIFCGRNNIKVYIAKEVLDTWENSTKQQKTIVTQEVPKRKIINESKDNSLQIPNNSTSIRNNLEEQIYHHTPHPNSLHNMGNTELVSLLKMYLSEYDYENVIMIDDELRKRHLDVWHDFCKKDFL